MKIRIRDNSIRLRLSRPEVEHVAAGHPVQGLTVFPAGSTFVYRLVPAPVEAVEAERTLDGIVVRLPGSWAQGWNDDDRTGFRAKLSIERPGDPEATLDVRIEKDFHCMKPRRDGEDDGTYNNPEADAAPSQISQTD